ncbi:MAG TPA: alpha/beta fold hydrolase [Streptosporangiaceae bacterium]
MNPDRTLIAVQRSGDDPQLACWRLGASGEVPQAAPMWVLPGEREGDWRILSWAATGQVALWRRRGGRAEMMIENVEGEAEETRHAIMGRPVGCRATPSGQVEVMVAVPLGRRVMLCLLAPESDSYLPLWERGESASLGAWDARRRVAVLNLAPDAGAPAVRVVSYSGRSRHELPVSWPPQVRPLRAMGYARGIAGLTGVDGSGRTVPGVVEVSTGRVRWLAEHAGCSCADVDPSCARLLAVHCEGESVTYRMMDMAGQRARELPVGPGVASDLRITRDGEHVIGCFQSPALPPAVTRWNVRTGRRQALGPRPVATSADSVKWELRWVPDAAGRGIPEWVFSPGRPGNVGTVLYLHGGPGGQLSQAYEPVIAALASAGWAVRGMNYPGSSGYGAQYRDVVIGDWGGTDARSVERRLRSLHERSGGRPICLYGQSYGGYLALLAAAAVPDLLSAVAVWAPVTDLPQMLAAARGTQRRWLEGQLGDLRFDRRQLWERSPVSQAPALLETPLLIGHGGRDEKCPVEQSRRLIEMLGEQSPADCLVRYMEDPDSPHTPLRWDQWAGAVLAHYESALSRVLPREAHHA